MRKEKYNSEKFIQDFVSEYGKHFTYSLFINSVVQAFNKFNQTTKRYIHYQVNTVNIDGITFSGTNMWDIPIYIVVGFVQITGIENGAIEYVPFGIIASIRYESDDILINVEEGDYETSFFSEYPLSNEEWNGESRRAELSGVLAHISDISDEIVNYRESTGPLDDDSIFNEGSPSKSEGLDLSDILDF